MRRGRLLRLIGAATAVVAAAFLAPMAVRAPGPAPPPRARTAVDVQDAAIARGASGPSVGSTVPASVLPGIAGPEVAFPQATPTVLLFFRSQCATCPDELAGLAAVAASTGGRVRTVAVSLDEDPAQSEPLVRAAASEGLVEVGADPGRTVAGPLGVVDVPATIVLDPSGIVVADWREAIGISVLHAFLRRTFL
ncbi:MAG TPA: TlpA disulfide reductase family protein [Actinomycetota bacterium]|nr:TlpA disulfide reductase family protein [Actinomycetota bacterium]